MRARTVSAASPKLFSTLVVALGIAPRKLQTASTLVAGEMTMTVRLDTMTATWGAVMTLINLCLRPAMCLCHLSRLILTTATASPFRHAHDNSM